MWKKLAWNSDISMQKIFDRVDLLFGDAGMELISRTKVILFGLGGVGSWTAECLVRTGIRHLTIVDCDRVAETNINRQLPATINTVGEWKTDALASRLAEINPEAEIVCIREAFTAETSDKFELDNYDYIIDAIDSLKDKAHLILAATHTRATLYSSMGAALKIDVTKIGVTEFRNVKGCPLARALRQWFKRHNEYPAKRFKAVYSDELIQNTRKSGEICGYKAQINGSLCHITAIFGMTLAGLLFDDLRKKTLRNLNSE